MFEAVVRLFLGAEVARANHTLEPGTRTLNLNLEFGRKASCPVVRVRRPLMANNSGLGRLARRLSVGAGNRAMGPSAQQCNGPDHSMPLLVVSRQPE